MALIEIVTRDADDRAWLSDFEAYFDVTGIGGVSARNVVELIRIAKHGAGPDDGVNQPDEDRNERIELIGGVSR